MAVLTAAFPDPAQRARALGTWAATTGAALAAGPVVGGVLTDALGWRSVFAVNVPVALASLLLTRRLAPETATDPARGVDLPGQACAVLALAGLTFGVIEGGTLGWGSPAVLAALAVAVAAGALFVAVERRQDAPMLPLALFRSRVFSAGLLCGLLVNFGVSGVLFVMSLYFQQTRGLSALLAGCAFLPLTLPTAFNPVYTGRLVARRGPRRPALLGFALLATGAGVLAAGGSVPVIGLGLLLFGFGVSFAIPALVTAVLAATPGPQAGAGAGALNSARQTGAVVGVAALGAVLHATGTGTALVVAAAVLAVGLVMTAAAIGRP
jgi:DHA2 family methylenomycin A resistance protein-like MFS transporter